MTTPWATADAWRDAPWPRAAIVDDDRLIVAEGARRTFASPATTSAAASLAIVPDDTLVLGCARFAPASADGDIDRAWAPFGGALWFEPARRAIHALPTVAPPPNAPGPAHDAGDGGGSVDVIDVDGARFRDAVARALARLAQGDVQKLVLARRFFVPLPGAFSRVPSFFASLLSSSSTSGGGAAYLVAPRAGCALLGLSPERLVVVDDEHVCADAVAGTRATTRADELATSEKDVREHALVVDHLRRALSSPMAEAAVGARGLRTVGAVTHLHTTVRARRASFTNVASLVEVLHPTPAVAGWPTDAAVREVQGLEGFDRGIYGGVVGVIGPRRTSLSVALRGALVSDEGLSITVGAGVVVGSSVEGEDAETRLKLDAVLASLGLRRRRT